MKHTETVENIVKAMQSFAVYKDMPSAEQLTIAEDVKREIEEHDIFLHEYLTFRFETLLQEERRKYLPISEYAWRLPNNVNIINYSGKYEFNNKAKQFISRDYICLEDASREDFRSFIGRHEQIIAKPLRKQCGTGITVYHTADWKPDELYGELIVKDTPLAEEYVYQHLEMAKFHPDSLNTLRVTTFTDFNGNISFKAAYIRTGCGSSVVDNICKCGIGAPIDMNTGIIAGDGVDSTCHTYEKHPDTGVVFKGFAIPRFDKVMKKVDEYTKLFSEMHFVGWDIAIKENGDIELIEANLIPDLTSEQLFYGPLAEKFRKLYGSREYGK